MKTPLISPKKLVFLVICAALFLSTGFMNKYGIIEKIAQKLDAYSREHLSEQIYLHLDKDRVLPGETLWFKAYRRNPNPAVIRKESNMMTLELWDTEGKRKKQRFPARDGPCQQFLLRKRVGTGSHHERRDKVVKNFHWIKRTTSDDPNREASHGCAYPECI